MADKLRKAVTWITLAQIVLVGALGTGLHGVLGCEHGPLSCEHSNCCALVCRSAAESKTTGRHDCAACRRAQSYEGEAHKPSADVVAFGEAPACCDGCAVCDLLMQYHAASPAGLDRLTLELANGEAPVRLENAVVSAATRLALSRGPPVA